MYQTFSIKRIGYWLIIIGIGFNFSCIAQKGTKVNKEIIVNGKKISYDDSLMNETATPYLLPFNRIIDGAGTVATFGSTELENHSLDAALMSDTKTVVVEDRYGIAFFDVAEKKLIYRLAYDAKNGGKKMMSVYSGIKTFSVDGNEHIFWSGADGVTNKSFVFEADWDGKKSKIINTYSFDGLAPAPSALANELFIRTESGETYMYVVLNGNSQLAKLRLKDKKIVWQTNTGMAPYGLTIVQNKVYVSNWAGSVPNGTSKDTAGVPYAAVNINPVTGATSQGTVSVIDAQTGQIIKEITTGLHPNAIIKSHDEQFVFVANGNSDDVSVISTSEDKVISTISVRLNGKKDDLIGDSPNALAIDKDDKTLFIANGGDNAVAVVNLGNASKQNGISCAEGYIPTQAYPGGLVLDDSLLIVTNLEGVGARVAKNKSYNTHKQEATVSFIPLPNEKELAIYTAKVKVLNMQFRTELSKLLPRKNVKPVPVPERIGEPSTIKHIIYIIKENRTYDQVLGDMKEGWGDSSLCSFGANVTPNEHLLAKQYGLLDNYHASGKCSAEGHQWTDAAMVTDYVEKNVRAWFRSYPHVQQDALVYDEAGFIWNQALDHGKTVRIYGEACEPEFDKKLSWTDIYQLYNDKKPFEFKNNTTISRVEPILSKTYPGYDSHKINDQIRADAFLKEWKGYENMTGDQLPQLIIIALPADHTAGTRPSFPTPSAMVADNDLALGRIVETITHSRFWDSTAIFVTEDDSQDGWDHISAYRTPSFIISPYSPENKVIHTNYNQTSLVRTIEQILGIPPMNKFDATASPMFSCFTNTVQKNSFQHLTNKTPLDEMNKSLGMTKGKENYYARMSMQPQFDHIDGGNDDLLNRILWYSIMGKKAYPVRNTLRLKDDDGD
jgi:YVTN family beta-propeller protein